jgi:hypothetical protein
MARVGSSGLIWVCFAWFWYGLGSSGLAWVFWGLSGLVWDRLGSCLLHTCPSTKLEKLGNESYVIHIIICDVPVDWRLHLKFDFLLRCKSEVPVHMFEVLVPDSCVSSSNAGGPKLRFNLKRTQIGPLFL